MKKIINLTLCLFILIGLTSCMFDGVRGDGNVISKKRKISKDFIRIDASRGLDVYITKSKNISLEVEADENLHELIETEVRNGTLYITASKNIHFASSKKIHLSADHINEISVNSGAEVYSENTFVSEKLVISVNSGAHANLELKVGDLSCRSSSGAEVNLSGEAESFNASSSSGSDINAYDLITRDCKADASSGSGIELMVTESFEGKASSGGDIKYKGHPHRAEKNNSSGGTIRNIDNSL